VTGQPWGVFFLSFEDKAMSVTVLRRILRALVVSKRGESKGAERTGWDKRDLIFAANFGKSGGRELAFVHFNDGASTGDLPVMKVLGWNARDTILHNRYAANMLSKQLAWPDDPSNLTNWRNQWASAFSIGHREVITTAQELAKRLAALAGDIRARVNQLLDAETETGPMRVMLKSFQKNLIHELDDDGFADMFAQTICYGLLAASISSVDDEGRSAIVADRLENMVPRTNPFLKELFSNFLHLGGRDKTSALDFDELGVRDVVDMLNQARMGRVLEDFGNRNPKKDPVIHFYEDFLREYDRDQKVDAGIFYTPPAVVGFIVRGVDEMLRTEFDLPLGLADTTTWGELAARNKKIAIPDHIDPDLPFVQILDPATGTGTFVVEVIDLIHKRMVDTWKAESQSAGQIKAAWNAYVPDHLLPRITAFELKMAAYSIAHMKIGLKLVETGYSFGSDERAHILLTNSLQPPRDLDLDERARQVAFAHEAERANEAKQCGHFTVVVGNPPYKGHSMNPSKIKGKLTFAGEIIQRFFQVRGVPLGEKNPKWLNNDYVKFIAFAMRQIERSGTGVLGYITSNSWLDSPTFRGVRTEVMDSFPLIRIVDLHGNVDKREVAPDGTRDEGVFDIEEGTNIAVAGKLVAPPSVRQADLLGRLGEKTGDNGKIDWLESHSLSAIKNTLTPASPTYLFTPSKSESKGRNLLQKEFYSASGLPEVFPFNTMGIISKRDPFCFSIDREEMLARVRQLADAKIEDFRTLYELPSDNDWVLENAKNDVLENGADIRFVKSVNYAPLNKKFTYYTGKTRGFLARPVWQTMQHFDGANVALSSTRKVDIAAGWEHAFAVDDYMTHHAVSNKEGNYVFLLWLNPTLGEEHRRPNIDHAWAKGVGQALNLIYEDGIARGQQGSLGKDFIRPKAEQIGLLDTPWDGRGDLAKTLGPRDLFDYIYAVLHAPTYRSRYAEFLKSDFPRIPTPGTRALFAALVPLGHTLVALHLLKADDAPALKDPDIRFAGAGEARVGKGYPEYANGKVMINASRWFEDVPKATYEFRVGGYQPCEKWLKDRAAKGGKKQSDGRVLTDEDILHYRRVVTSLTETRRIMAEIDKVIETHGGWPGAFKVGAPGEQEPA
jgi:predicted helicase